MFHQIIFILPKVSLPYNPGEILKYIVPKTLWPSFLFVTSHYIYFIRPSVFILSHDEVEGNIGICQGQQDLDNDPEGAGSPALLTLKSTKDNNTAYH